MLVTHCFLCVTHTIWVWLTEMSDSTETQRKTENIDDISFQTSITGMFAFMEVILRSSLGQALLKACGKCPEGGHLVARASSAPCILMSLVVERSSLSDIPCYCNYFGLLVICVQSHCKDQKRNKQFPLSSFHQLVHEEVGNNSGSCFGFRGTLQITGISFFVMSRFSCNASVFHNALAHYNILLEN